SRWKYDPASDSFHIGRGWGQRYAWAGKDTVYTGGRHTRRSARLSREALDTHWCATEYMLWWYYQYPPCHTIGFVLIHITRDADLKLSLQH
ncbi:MAG: hypothetical protein ABI604_06115, partial [Nitrospirota bacterium]